MNYRKANKFFDKGQVVAAAGTAFMHGAQDGQKFMGVFLLGLALAQGSTSMGAVSVPVWLMVVCSLVMAFGTSIGGMKIIKSVGMDMVKLEKYQGLCGGYFRDGRTFGLFHDGNARFHYARENDGDHGRGSGEAGPFGELGRGEGNGAHLDPHLSGLRTDRLSDD